MTEAKKVKVLIVDDSAVIRQILTQIISNHDDLEVVGTAADPYIAREKIKQLVPDVITLDVEMPRMDGITFLKNLMRLRPMPVIMISTLTEAGADIIDINMGCPSRQVTGGQSGSALMRDEAHAAALIGATVAATPRPVTLKMRLGWDHNSLNAPNLARIAGDLGVAMITVHGRTRCQFYKGSADWRAIRAVVDAVRVPPRCAARESWSSVRALRSWRRTPSRRCSSVPTWA